MEIVKNERRMGSGILFNLSFNIFVINQKRWFFKESKWYCRSRDRNKKTEIKEFGVIFLWSYCTSSQSIIIFSQPQAYCKPRISIFDFLVIGTKIFFKCVTLSKVKKINESTDWLKGSCQSSRSILLTISSLHLALSFAISDSFSRDLRVRGDLML